VKKDINNTDRDNHFKTKTPAVLALGGTLSTILKELFWKISYNFYHFCNQWSLSLKLK